MIAPFERADSGLVRSLRCRSEINQRVLAHGAESMKNLVRYSKEASRSTTSEIGKAFDILRGEIASFTAELKNKLGCEALACEEAIRTQAAVHELIFQRGGTA